MIERQNGAEDDVILVLTTFPNVETARQIGTQWLDAQLIACMNLLPGAESLYRWAGQTEHSREVLAWVKTTRPCLEALEISLRQNHPYELPECLVLSPEGGSREFLAWVRGETTLDKPAS